MPISQGLHALYIYDMTNTKISSSSACDIYPRAAHYCLVQFMVVLLNLNAPSIMVVHIIHLVQIVFFLCRNHRWELIVLYYHKIMVMEPYPFLVVINQLSLWIIFINDRIYILTGSPG